MIKRLFIFLLAGICMTFIACGKEEQQVQQPQEKQTVYIYDSNKSDIEELEEQVKELKEQKPSDEYLRQQFYSQNASMDIPYTWGILEFDSSGNICGFHQDPSYLSREEIQDTINEIYARKGYRFKDEAFVTRYRNNFLYPMNIDNMDDVPLTATEKHLIEILAAFR